MRIYEYDTTTIEYPNAVHFAFVPAIIKVTDIPAIYNELKVTIHDLATGATYYETREPLNGAAHFDIRRYLQLLFNALEPSHVDDGRKFVDSPLKRTARVTVTWLKGNQQQALKTFDIDAIWGAISARESTGGTMRRRWFVNYPFTVDVFAKNDTSIEVLVDGKQSEGDFSIQEPDATGATPYHRYLLSPALLIDPSTVTRFVHIDLPYSLVLKDDWDTPGRTAYTLDVDRSTDGVYLRWVDRQGRYCYYLFREIGSATTVAASSVWERSAMTVPTAYVGGVNVETSVRQNLSRKITRSLGARLVDSETYDFLLTLTQSVVVDVLDGYVPRPQPISSPRLKKLPYWHRVNVVAGGYEKAAKHYQDFIVSIEEPAQSAQML